MMTVMDLMGIFLYITVCFSQYFTLRKKGKNFMTRITKFFLAILFGGMLISNLTLAAGVDGQALFNTKCKACHDGGKNVKGGADCVKVTTDGKAPMPSYKDKLSADEIKALCDLPVFKK